MDTFKESTFWKAPNGQLYEEILTVVKEQVGSLPFQIRQVMLPKQTLRHIGEMVQSQVLPSLLEHNFRPRLRVPRRGN